MADELTITVRVVPRASKSEVVDVVEGQLKVRITAPPVDGAANAELIKLLSKHFNVPKRNVELLTGETSRVKKIRISGLNDDRIDQFLKGSL